MSENRLFIFDIDDTLTETVPLQIRLFRESLAVWGFTHYDSDFGAYPEINDRYIFRDIYEKQTGRLPREQEIEQFQATLTGLIRAEYSGMREVPGAGAFLRALQRAGQPFSFVTGAFRGAAGYKLHKMGIRPDEFPLLTASEFALRSELFLESAAAAERFYGRKFQKISMFGDSLRDLQTCAKTGCTFVGIGERSEKFPGAGRDFLTFRDYLRPAEMLRAAREFAPVSGAPVSV